MKIYSAEQAIQDKIKANIKSSLTVPIENKQIDKDTEASAIANAQKSLAGYEHPDLMYGSAILTSTVMNENDDVFLPDHTWAARHTTINTPCNNKHNEEEIIGHITNYRILDSDFNVVADESDGPPSDGFHLEVDRVIYQDIFPEIAEEIAKGFKDGNKFVSMECFIDDFDYALIDNNEGNTKIISRNEDTAFLTKYLRTYGGTGEWQGKKLGRVLKNIRFSGMGENLSNPANPQSMYTQLSNFNLVEAQKEDIISSEYRSNPMSGENTNEIVEQLKAEKKELKDELEKLQKSEQERLEASQKELNEKLEVEQKKLETAEQNVEQLKSEKQELEEEKSKLNEQLEAKEKELNDIKADKLLSERLQILNELGIEYDSEDQEELNRIKALSEDSFDEITKYVKKAKESVQSESNSETEEESENDETTEESEEKSKASEELSSTEEENEPSPEETSGESEHDSVEDTGKKLAQSVFAYKNKRKSKNK